MDAGAPERGAGCEDERQSLATAPTRYVLDCANSPNLIVLAFAVVAVAQPLLGLMLKLAPQQSAGIIRHASQPLF